MTAAERVQALCARVRATRYPEPFVAALAAYLGGDLPLADLTAAAEEVPYARRNIASLLVADLGGRAALDAVDLRVLDYCRSWRFGERDFIAPLARNGPIGQLVAMLEERGTPPDEIVAILFIAPALFWDEGRPSALGRFLAAQAPGPDAPPPPLWPAIDRRLRPEKLYPRLSHDYRHNAGTSFVHLLLALTPPRVDLAWEYAQLVGDDYKGACAAALLRADPARFTEHARQMAGRDVGEACEQRRYEALVALMELDPARHLDLAIATFREQELGDYSRLRMYGLSAAFRYDPAAYWHLAEEGAAQTGHLAASALRLMAEVDFPRAIPAAQAFVAARDGFEEQRALRELLLGREWPGRQAYALATLAHRQKGIRDIAADWLARQGPAAVPELAGAMAHPSADARLAAVAALRQIGGEAARAALVARLDAERSQKVRQAILDIVGPQVPPGESVRVTLAAEAAATFRRVSWAPPAWIDPAAAGLRWADGAPLDAAAVTYLLYRQSRAKAEQLDPQIAPALAQIEAGSAAAYALALWQGWLDVGAVAAEAWVLPLAATLGDERLVLPIRRQIDAWSKGTRRKLAATLVRALATNAGELALAEVDDVATRARAGIVRQTAARAMVETAARLGLTQEELLDRATPRLGLDGRGERVFDYGSRRFTMRLGPDGAPQILDGAGKSRKSMPAPGAADDPALAPAAYSAGRALAAQLKEVTERLRRRLERAMVAQRAWGPDRWRALFVAHPIARRLAWGLVWMADAGAGAPPLCFRPLEDGSLTGADDEPLELPAGVTVRLLHPALADEAARTAWQRHLADYELAQPFPQLARPAQRLDPALAQQAQWTACQGYVVVGSALTTRRAGSTGQWELSAAEDGGSIYTVTRSFPDVNLVASIALLGGLGVWERHAGKVILGALTFHTGALTAHRASVRGPALRLGAVPPAVFSEAAADALTFAASGAYEPKWEIMYG